MAMNRQDRLAGRGAALRLQLALALTWASGVSGLSACTDQLPAFANPPPVDAGSDASEDGSDDEDGG